MVFVKASNNIPDYDVNFNHLIKHVLSCTLEKVDKDVSSCVGLRFGTFDETLLDQSNKN